MKRAEFRVSLEPAPGPAVEDESGVSIAFGPHGAEQVEFIEATTEDLPLGDECVDVVISNGVFNLTPDKPATLAEWHRVLRPGGRIQIADILVDREVPEGAKRKIDLWTG